MAETLSAARGMFMVMATDDLVSDERVSRRGNVRRVAGIVALVVVLAALAVYGRWWWADRSYVGGSERIVLEWDCFNWIFWTDPSNDAKWWAGKEPAMTGRSETGDRTAAPDNGPINRKHAAGVIHFDSADTATFTSDAGGTMPFTRQPGTRFYEASCALGPGG